MQNSNYRFPRSIAGRRAWAVPAVLVLIAACTGGDSVTQPENRTETMPWELDLNYDAITMAVGEVVQLQATPLKRDGTPMTGIAAPIYTTSDTSVRVNASGQLTASTPRTSVSVFARIQNLEGNWTVADTVRVLVVATPFAFTSFDMRLSHPPVVPANDANDGVDARRFRFDAKVYDAAGNVVLGAAGDTIRPMTFYAASVPKNVYDISTPWSPLGFARNIGNVTVRGTARIFGFDYQDEVSFRITYPDSAVLNVYRVSTVLTPSPSMMSQTDLTILRGGKIGFRSSNPTETVSIGFADPTVVGGALAAVPNSPTIRIVTFPNLGQFTYTSPSGFAGTITVVDP